MSIFNPGFALNVKITTASKKAEDIFDSPLSSTVITRKDMVSAGVTTISEAFRLIPGMVVREQTNGNFDVSIRGQQAMTSGDMVTFAAEARVLVMIDNRPVYNYYGGGTFWETLPIGMTDIDRIEVVRGAAGALYGPNAVMGVINIITTRGNKEGMNISVDGYAGLTRTNQASATFSYNKENLKAGISGNYAIRERYKTEYYSFKDQKFKATPEEMPGSYKKYNEGTADEYINSTSGTGTLPYYNTDKRYPADKRNRSLDQAAVNGFLNYKFSEQLNLDLSAGYQTSYAQKIYYENLATPLSASDSKTYFADMKLKGYDATLQVSYLAGDQNALGLEDKETDSVDTSTGERVYNGSKVLKNFATFYDFNVKFSTIDANLEYDYQWNNLNIRPGVVYRLANYNSLYIKGNKRLSSIGGTLRMDYKLDDWRVIGAIRADNYSAPDQTSVKDSIYPAWQAIVSKKFGANNVVRAVYGRSNAFPTMSMAYLDLTIKTPASTILQNTHFQSKPEKLSSTDFYEVGYRTKINGNISWDTEAFINDSKNFVGFDNSSYEADVLSGLADIESAKAAAAAAGVTGVNTRATAGNVSAACLDTLNGSLQALQAGGNPAVALVTGGVLDASGNPLATACTQTLGTYLTKLSTYKSYVTSATSKITNPSIIKGAVRADAIQYGITTTLVYKPSTHFSGKLFLTAQQTRRFDYTGGVKDTKGVVHAYNPGIVAGFDLNYRFMNQFSADLNGYYYGSHTFLTNPFYIFSNPSVTTLTQTKDATIAANLMLNLRLGYEFMKGAEFFVSGRQLLSTVNSDRLSAARQSPFGDQIGRQFLVGFTADI